MRFGNVQAEPDQNLPIWMTIFLKKEGPKGLTVWKFHNFPITQILREINCGDSKSAELAISTWILHFLKAKIYQKKYFRAPEIAKMAFLNHLHPHVKSVEFLHCDVKISCFNQFDEFFLSWEINWHPNFESHSVEKGIFVKPICSNVL